MHQRISALIDFSRLATTLVVSQTVYWIALKENWTKPLRGGGERPVPIDTFGNLLAVILSSIFPLTLSLRAVIASVNQIHSRRPLWESYVTE